MKWDYADHHVVPEKRVFFTIKLQTVGNTELLFAFGLEICQVPNKFDCKSKIGNNKLTS